MRKNRLVHEQPCGTFAYETSRDRVTRFRRFAGGEFSVRGVPVCWWRRKLAAALGTGVPDGVRGFANGTPDLRVGGCMGITIVYS
ncbi:hypothetical protein NN3_26540 [Nocardia neocaledoniensis NBRC 108232]|nr:hypothetical protein NN3_26540 [Nocardia neocaledoniensis NBRC 108232]